jgi:2-C-methyl-D-erythritol 4-phosphate cytidylyltransferase
VTERVAAIIPAAGQGTRLVAATTALIDHLQEGGSRQPKAIRMLRGRTLLRHAAEALAPLVDMLVVAAPPGHVDDVRRGLADLPCRVDVLAGGATRQRSVQLALAVLPADVEYVLVHDAARPLVPPAVVERVLGALHAGAVVVVPVIPVVDSLRGVDATGASRPVDRAGIRAVQTPQGFSRAVLAAAHASATEVDATDDASLVERQGHDVQLVTGDPLAFKITRPLDLLMAEAVLREGSRSAQT